MAGHHVALCDFINHLHLANMRTFPPSHSALDGFANATDKVRDSRPQEETFLGDFVSVLLSSIFAMHSGGIPFR